jgi:uncharacterized protein YjiS (DUF1127 family)
MLGSFHKTQGFGEFPRTARISGRSEQPTASSSRPIASAVRILRQALHEAFVAHHGYWQLRQDGMPPDAAIRRAFGGHHARNEVHGTRTPVSTCNDGHRATPLAGNPRHWMGGKLRALAGTLMRLIGQSRQRSALADLDDRLLLDIGITRWQAEREAVKPFWCADKI